MKSRFEVDWFFKRREEKRSGILKLNFFGLLPLVVDSNNVQWLEKTVVCFLDVGGSDFSFSLLKEEEIFNLICGANLTLLI